jgi:hypothetical protein
VRRSSAIVLALALLLLVAFLIHRAPRHSEPVRPPKRPSLLEGQSSKDGTAKGEVPAASTAISVVPVRFPAPPASERFGTIRGVVRWNGPVPARKTIRTSSDPKCQAMHGERILSDQLMVDAGGNMQWAFVYIKSGIAGRVPPAPATPVHLDQVSCVFTPHVTGIRVGQPLIVVNSDEFLHNVHAMAIVNREFNFGLPESRMQETRVFDRPEVMILVKCDIHPWMRAWVGVLDHPYFAVSNAVGSYVIQNVPPGAYEVEAWHEKCGSVNVQTVVAADRETLLDFVLDAKKD